MVWICSDADKVVATAEMLSSDGAQFEAMGIHLNEDTVQAKHCQGKQSTIISNEVLYCIFLSRHNSNASSECSSRFCFENLRFGRN